MKPAHREKRRESWKGEGEQEERGRREENWRRGRKTQKQKIEISENETTDNQ
jgi:hypothetical protein